MGYDLAIEEADRTHSAFSVRALVIATGARVLSHELFGSIPGFQALFDAGLIAFSPIGHIERLAALHNKTVAVIGGGDNAHFTAKDVTLAGAQTYLLMRSHSKARTGIRKEVEDLIAQNRITERTGTQISAFQKHQDGIEIVLTGADGTSERIIVDMIFARTGFAANTEFLDTFDAFSGITKAAGYLVTDAAKRTSIPWVYAIGDVANPKHQSVVAAIADGAIAAQDLSERV
jgi:thioredoxin reductase